MRCGATAVRRLPPAAQPGAPRAHGDTCTHIEGLKQNAKGLKKVHTLSERFLGGKSPELVRRRVSSWTNPALSGFSVPATGMSTWV